MWVPIFFKGQFWVSMRSTQRSESMHAFFGGYLHCKTSFVQFIHEFDNVLGKKEQKELENDAADSRGVIPCATSSAIERQFQQEYTNDMFRDVQTEFDKKTDCNIRAVYEQGDSAWVKVEEEILAYEKTRYVTHNVHFDHSTHQEFVNGDDEADMLHAALDDARAKLVDYRAKLRNKTVADAHTSIATETSFVVGTKDIQGPSKDNHVESCENIDLDAPARQIVPQEVGGFMSLLNSFGNT
ncbi:hypothetical protein Ahy_B04g073001 isoform B [Arachis hypogaea]|uniref:Protein FAR1-RELATED SEQUENCE n=1 Tax=Arachis hypogaea TaxID=3818 RepID=A0A444ZPB0_ARAHY|nr:hypothetical protein Ahy_B04g073001 isoform B [Arachis hypogaea]